MTGSIGSASPNPGEVDPAQQEREVAVLLLSQAQAKKTEEGKDKIEPRPTCKPYHQPGPGLALRIARFFNWK